MRTSNSVKNSTTSIMCYITSIIIGFVSQSIFIKILGAEYLGLNGLFSNILAMLSLFELGIGSAIIYNLYKPIANNKIEEIKSLMKFYKKVYNIIAFMVLFVGLLIIPFLKYIVGEVTVDINIHLVYFLYLLSTVSSYVITYKRSLIYANQQNYVINIIRIGYLLFANITKLVILYITKNYYLYIIIMIIGQIIENIVISIVANKMYPYLLDRNVKTLNKDVEKDIFSRVKALFLHKIAIVIINGTDNILISSFFGIATVGLYSSYHLIINPVQNLFSQIINSTTASVGNLIVTESKEKCFKIFKRIRFLNFWLATFSSICLFVIIQSFVVVWIGKEYLLNISVVLVVVLNYFQQMMRNTYVTFKDSAGIWREDKFVPLIESILNIVFSIICIKIFGLAGVFIGTIISGLALWCYSYPKYVYKKLFNRSYINYAKETLGYIILFVLLATLTYEISTIFTVSNIYLQLIINILISITIPNIILIILFRKNDNFKYFLNLINKFLHKIKI